ncbi:MAG: hypothetical protein A3G87_03835 [Omnitrophica bacterium RIFCSPLOWO2_12_FULL_50_11]|nr:MAG: hypothetical protein A3G87_03835 [Omnitrophica bacterium RIFCSPLOWO2_12_FULL_50_11]
MSVLLEFSITPLDKGESVGKYVARSIDLVDKSGIDYQLGPMGTSIEGEWDDVMAVVKKCFDEMKRDCRRISVAMKADYREGASNRIRGKVESVEKRLGHPVKK